MFLNTVELESSIDDIVSLSNRLCFQAERLRKKLHDASSIDDNISSAVNIAETSVSNDIIVALLAMVQCVDRDTENGFAPIINIQDNDASSVALSNMADVALLALSDLYAIAEAYIKSKGWFPVDRVQGGIVYENESSGEISEEPEIKDDNTSWQMKLLLSIPILIEPGCVDGKVVWAAAVVYYQRLHHALEDLMRQYDLECADEPSSTSIRGGSSCIDVLKSDEDGQSSCMRGTYHGCWRGLYAEAVGEMDMSKNVGQVLESWTDTTLTGLSVITESSARVLVFGLASGQLISFLQQHNPNAQFHIVEASPTAVHIARTYYNLHHSVLDCVHPVDPMKYVKSECLKGAKFDTIIVNVCSSEEIFPTESLNDEFFNGLISMLSNQPSATLLVNSGASVDTVVALVDGACKHIGHRHGHMLVFREYLLREHADTDNNGGIIASRRREWSFSVEDWQKEHMGEHFQCSGAMAVSDAQQTEVVRLQKFLSVEDIELIHKVAEDARTGSYTERHTGSWNVLYLQHNNVFKNKLPDLRQRILEAVRRVDKKNWSLFDNVEHVNIRVVEYHHMDEFGELADPKHYDLNSLLTMDIMLSEEGAFEGGDLQTEEADGTLKKHKFKQGDALVFVSHKPHCVGRVRSGRRNVMVLEFWYGPERQCPHRCEQFGHEICDIDPAQALYTQQNPHSKLDYQLEHAENPHSKLDYQLEHADTPSIPLPFRLGSVSMCKEGSDEILELLWEPSGNTEIVPDKLVSASEEVVPNLDEVWSLFD